MTHLPPALLSLASRQHGLIRRDQALLFLGEDALARLVGPRGRWHIPVRGVYATFTGSLTRQQQLFAAWLYVGAESMLTSVEGCREYGMQSLPEFSKMTWLISHIRKRQSRDYVVVRRTRFLPMTATIISDVPVAPLARCVMDAARELKDIDAVRAVMMESVQRRRLLISHLQTELELGTMDGSARPRMVIDELIAGARSPAESWYVRLLASSAVLPPAHHNCTLLTPDREFLAVPDGYIKAVGLAGEIQSLKHHLDGLSQEHDMARRARMIRFDVAAIEARPNRIHKDGRGLLADHEAAYLERLARGVRPRVLLKCRPECPLRYESDVGPDTPKKAE